MVYLPSLPLSTVILLLPAVMSVTLALTFIAFPVLSYSTVVPLPLANLTVSPALTFCTSVSPTFNFQYAALMAFATSFAVTKPESVGMVILPSVVVDDKPVLFTFTA